MQENNTECSYNNIVIKVKIVSNGYVSNVNNTLYQRCFQKSKLYIVNYQNIIQVKVILKNINVINFILIGPHASTETISMFCIYLDKMVILISWSTYMPSILVSKAKTAEKNSDFSKLKENGRK